MIIEWLRGIFSSSEDRARIAALHARLSIFEDEQENLMSRIDDLTAIVVEVGGALDALAAHVNAISAELATAGVEDPRVGLAVDDLRAIKGRIDALVPAPAPAPEPEVAAG